MKKVVVNSNDAGQRLDKFLSKTFYALPKSLMYKLIRKKQIRVNNKKTVPEYVLCKDDEIIIFVSDEYLVNDNSDDFIKTMNPHLDVVYEDDDILLCNKVPGLCCVPDKNESKNVLANYIKAYLYQKNEYDPDSENSFAPALCNRIDRNTGGIVIAAKNAETLRRINLQIKERKIDKFYLCIAHGRMPKEHDILKSWMIKDSDKNLVDVFDKDPGGDSKTMITEYDVISYKDDLSLLKVTLHTGRTHQIRAHLAHIGHPLLGDGKYSKNREDVKMGYKYQALYSYMTVIDDVEYSVDPENIWFVRELFGDCIDKIKKA